MTSAPMRGAMVCGVAVLLATAARGQSLAVRPETTLVCTPSQLSATMFDTIRVQAFVDPAAPGYAYTWSAAHGRIQGMGTDVRWLFDEAPLGFDTLMLVVTNSGKQIGTCTARVVVVQPGNRGSGDLLARSFLLPREREAMGYGVYHYLLFGSRPSAAMRARYLAAIAEYLRLAPSLAEFARGLEARHVPPAERTVTYIPVTASPSGIVTAEWVLDHYDYGRAKLLLSALPGTHRNGPYLVSVREGLSRRRTVSKEFLIQDLSVVNPALVPAWITQALNDAGAERFNQGWDPQRSVLRVRTALSALAEGVPEVKRAMTSWSETFSSWVSWSK